MCYINYYFKHRAFCFCLGWKCMFIIFCLGEESIINKAPLKCMTLNMPLNISGLQFRAVSVLMKGLIAIESYDTRACSLCTLFGYMVWEASSWHMDCLQHCICFVSIQASLFRGHNKKGWHANYAFSSFHLHFTHFRVHSFDLVC